MSTPPSGTVTFLFSDIEGSTRLAQAYPAAWEAARAWHHTLLRAAVEAHHGYVFQIVGDGFCVAFATAPDALAAALEAQHELQRTDERRAKMDDETLQAGNTQNASDSRRPIPVVLRVRMGLHTGAAEPRDGGYHGFLTLAHVQRVMAAAHGGQVLLSNATAALIAAQLPDGIRLRDMGEHRLKGLLNPERLCQLMAPELLQDFPPLQTLNTIPNNLPIQVTSFVGRERELSELEGLLTTTRLLTLTGSGGTGKTRLSLQLAADVLDHYKDGIWFVELAPVADSTLVPQTVASVLSVREEPGRPLLSTLLEWLRSKQLLLILDNCEHLVEACGTFADAVLHSGQQTQILASSREALGIAGETTYRVPSLECPDSVQSGLQTIEQLSQYAAVQLFLDRAAQAQSNFKLNDTNVAAVTQICYRLDGIPLAIELAAARVKLFPPAQIAARLDDRFQLLSGGSRTALPRQRTLRGAIDWSYSLLSEPERLLLRRLSVFAGGWYFEAAETVCAGEGIDAIDVMDLLARLVEKSLVVEEDVRGMARYHLLETIRQYAREKLREAGESDRVRTRHLSYFWHLATSFAENWDSRAQGTWAETIERNLDNFRAALEWSMESSDFLPSMRMAEDLGGLWLLRFPAQGLEQLSKFLARLEAQPPSLPRALALFAKGSIQSFAGDFDSARRCFEEALSIGKASGAEPLVAALLRALAGTAIALDDYGAASAYLTEGLDIARRLGDASRIGDFLYSFGDVALRQEDFAHAYSAYEEAVRVLRPLREKSRLPVPLRRLGQLARRRADYPQAERLIGESLSLNRDGNDIRAVTACVSALAAVRATQGDLLAATKLCGAVATLLETVHARLSPVDQDEYAQTVAALRAQVAPSAFDAAWAVGRTLSLERATALALQTEEGR